LAERVPVSGKTVDKAWTGVYTAIRSCAPSLMSLGTIVGSGRDWRPGDFFDHPSCLTICALASCRQRISCQRSPELHGELKILLLPVLLPRPSQTLDAPTRSVSPPLRYADSLRPSPPVDDFRHLPDTTGVAGGNTPRSSTMVHELNPREEKWQ